MHCPYCGTLFSNSQLHTRSQIEYMREVGVEKAKEYVYGEFDKMFSKLSNSFRGSNFITIKHNPIRYRAKPVLHDLENEGSTLNFIALTVAAYFRFMAFLGTVPAAEPKT